jgi:hypothetical protein
MDEFCRLFDVNHKHRVLICLGCQYAVVPSQVKTHLQVYHKHISLQQRNSIVLAVEATTELARTHAEVIYPTPTDPPISTLPTYFDGLKCHGRQSQGTACSYVCRTARGIREHCHEKHGWMNQQKRGGDIRSKQVHASNKIWTEHHACQRFFKATSWQRYFEVARQDVQSGVQRTNKKREFFQAQENDIQQAEHDATDDANRVHGFDEHRSAVVPWLRETGIVDNVHGLNKDEIRTAIAVPPVGDKSDLRVVVDAMESLLRDAHRLCFDGPDCMLTYQCRVVLGRFQPSQVDLQGKTRLFDPYKEPSSLSKYFGIALRFVSYFGRVVAADDYHFTLAADTGDGSKGQRPEDVIKATDEQLAVWQDIDRIVRQIRTKEQNDDNDDNNADDEDSNDKLKERLLKLWILLICHTTGSRRYER